MGQYACQAEMFLVGVGRVVRGSDDGSRSEASVAHPDWVQPCTTAKCRTHPSLHNFSISVHLLPCEDHHHSGQRLFACSCRSRSQIIDRRTIPGTRAGSCLFRRSRCHAGVRRTREPNPDKLSAVVRDPSPLLDPLYHRLQLVFPSRSSTRMLRRRSIVALPRGESLSGNRQVLTTTAKTPSHASLAALASVLTVDMDGYSLSVLFSLLYTTATGQNKLANQLLRESPTKDAHSPIHYTSNSSLIIKGAAPCY